MSWRELLAGREGLLAPWTGGRDLVAGGRRFRVGGRLPDDEGWARFDVGGGRHAVYVGPAVPPDGWDNDREALRGWLVGDRLVPEGAVFVPEASRIPWAGVPVRLIEPGLDRFERVRAARWDDGTWLFAGAELPLGPEGDVEAAFQDGTSLDDVGGVPPSLDLAFRWAVWRRDAAEAERRRIEAERERQRRVDEAIRGDGDARGRRELAAIDFGAAARAALRLGGGELLDWRDGVAAGEAVVVWRVGGRRLRTTVDRRTLRVVDAGLCLVDHRTGERGDERFTLESLPSVVAEADATARLVVL